MRFFSFYSSVNKVAVSYTHLCPTCTRNEILAKGVSAVKVWKGYLANPLLTLDEKTATERLLQEAGVALLYVDLSKERMQEIFSQMLSVGDRTDYVFEP